MPFRRSWRSMTHQISKPTSPTNSNYGRFVEVEFLLFKFDPTDGRIISKISVPLPIRQPSSLKLAPKIAISLSWDLNFCSKYWLLLSYALKI